MSRRVPVLTTPCKFPTNKGPARSQTWSLRISLCTRRNIKCKTWLKMTPVKWVPSSSTGERGLASHKTLTQRQRREDSDELLTDFSSKFLLIIISRKELFTEISHLQSFLRQKCWKRRLSDGRVSIEQIWVWLLYVTYTYNLLQLLNIFFYQESLSILIIYI